MCWYCQEDGAQWNVSVHVAMGITIEGERMLVIHGERLSGERAGKHGVLIVPARTVHKEPQDNAEPPIELFRKA